MKKKLREYVLESLILENNKKNAYDNLCNSISTSDQSTIKSAVYNYLRIDSRLTDILNIKDDKDFLSKIENVYNKNGNDFYRDLSNEINLFHQNTSSSGQSIFQNGWFEIAVPNNKSITLGNVSGSQTVINRRHNIYITLRHNKISTKKISVSGFIDYFSDLSSAMNEFYQEAADYNDLPNNICNIFSFKTYMISRVTSLIPKSKNMTAFFRFFNEADNLKIYLSNVNRNTQNLAQAKKEISDLVKDTFEKNNFTVSLRERSDFGYDFQAKDQITQKEIIKTSFGDIVALILANQIANTDSIKNNIISSEEKLKEYIKQVEKYVSEPKNSTSIIRLINRIK